MRVRFPVLACMRMSLSGVVLFPADRPRAFVRDGAEVLDPLVRSVGGLGLSYRASGAAERPAARGQRHPAPLLRLFPTTTSGRYLLDDDLHAPKGRAAAMRTRIVKIGNSQGIRIPKALLAQTDLHGEVEISVRHGSLVISAAAPARSGWDDAFRQMAVCGDDRLLDGDVPSPESFDTRDWEWK